MANYNLHLIIKNRETILFEGDVFSVTSYNEIGRFDILPQHANFISLLKDKISYTDFDGKEVSISLNSGIIKVENNQVNIFLGIGNQKNKTNIEVS